MASALLKPLQLGPITLRNRIGMSALTRNRTVPGPQLVPNEVNIEYYNQRAAGGAGLIVSEGILIIRQGSEWPYAPGIWSKEQIEGWKKITDSVHSLGGHIYCQIWHLGRVSHPDAPEQKASGLPVYGPSAIAARGGKFRHIPGSHGYVTPEAIPDPWTIIAQYKQAAINAKEAGFDGVELHSANGYLITQFLDTTANKRTDEWGGSVENRARFGLEAMKAMIDVFGSDRVGIKISPTGGYNDVGMPIEETLETFNYYISEIDKLKPSYIALMLYVEALDFVFEGRKRATIHDVLTSYRPLIKNANVFLGAGITPEKAEELVASGKIDGVFFGRLWISHPDVAKRIEHKIPLDNQADLSTFYGHGGTIEEQRKGYTDYPAARQDSEITVWAPSGIDSCS